MKMPWWILLFFITACCPRIEERPIPVSSDYFLIVYVDAPHLDYRNNNALLQSIARNGVFGHAWIHLQGIVEGQRVFIEGGHSGELGRCQAKYFDGVMNYIEYGYANPTAQQKQRPRYEPNPIKYLWETQRDGFFQVGSGGHKPTFSVKMDLTSEQFECILSFIRNYDYAQYSLTDNQCSTFVAQIAALADFPLECDVTIPIRQMLTFRNETFCLWQDPRYSMLTFSSPDALESSLKQRSCQ